MTNMDYFNLYAGKIFAKLYQEFPRQAQLQMDELESTKRDELIIWVDTIRWLRDEGYIKYTNGSLNGMFFGCVLTEKGLEVLKAVPDGVTAQESLGDKISEIAKDGSVEAMKSLINKVLSAGVGMAASSIGM